MKKMLIAIDGSEGALKAVDYVGGPFCRSERFRISDYVGYSSLALVVRQELRINSYES